ncbi:MAG: hypothetical protein AVDCRST_MAG79-364, partial [uncultured Thermoleophilia bacterium]
EGPHAGRAVYPPTGGRRRPHGRPGSPAHRPDGRAERAARRLGRGGRPHPRPRLARCGGRGGGRAHVAGADRPRRHRGRALQLLDLGLGARADGRHGRPAPPGGARGARASCAPLPTRPDAAPDRVAGARPAAAGAR